jgi:hypothetical protein
MRKTGGQYDLFAAWFSAEVKEERSIKKKSVRKKEVIGGKGR